MDILVASAGIAKVGTIEETTVEDFDALFAVNVRAPYAALKRWYETVSSRPSAAA